MTLLYDKSYLPADIAFEPGRMEFGYMHRKQLVPCVSEAFMSGPVCIDEVSFGGEDKNSVISRVKKYPEYIFTLPDSFFGPFLLCYITPDSMEDGLPGQGQYPGNDLNVPYLSLLGLVSDLVFGFAPAQNPVKLSLYLFMTFDRVDIGNAELCKLFF